MIMRIKRGDRATITVGNLVDKNGAPTTFGMNDILTWTAKRAIRQGDSEAILKIGGDRFTFSGDRTKAEVKIVASDWSGVAISEDTSFVWDIQLAVGGDPNEIVTLDQDEGILSADVTLTVPTV